MDPVMALAPHAPDTVIPAAPVPIGANRTLAVTVTYRLSEEGRKASLLAGGDGRAVQELIVQVPASRLHLVSVDVNGVARLKLRPRFEMNGDQRVVRTDTPPAYDAPPDVEDLFREAAKNHQLEQLFEAERRSTRAKRREADQERRAELAQAFLNDPAMRALMHPPPTPKRCYITTERGRVLFDVATDAAPARDVPPEAHRRFRADLRARREENLRQRAEQLALHEEKKRFIAEWIAGHGTPDERARHAAGVLPMEEAIEAMTDQAFAALAEWPRYQHDGVARLQERVQQLRHAADAVVTRNELVVTTANAKEMTAVQWALVQKIQHTVPDASVTLRMHKLGWKPDPTVSLPAIVAFLVTTRVGPFLLRREYAMPKG